MRDDASLIDELNQLASQAKWNEIRSLVNREDFASRRLASGRSALIEIAHYGYVPIVRELVDQGADVNAVDDRGLTPLIAVLDGAGEGRQTIAAQEVLLVAGADPNRIGYLGQSPLHYALRKRLADHARILLENGANPNLKTHDVAPMTAFEIARQSMSQDLINLLRKFKT